MRNDSCLKIDSHPEGSNGALSKRCDRVKGRARRSARAEAGSEFPRKRHAFPRSQRARSDVPHLEWFGQHAALDES